MEIDYICIELKKKDMGDLLKKENNVLATRTEIVNVNGFRVKNQVIALFEKDFITTSTLGKLFRRYGVDDESLREFLNGNFLWRMPNSCITPFYHDPFSGEPIDWELIKVIYTH